MTTMTAAQKAWATRKARQANAVKAVRDGKATVDGFQPTKKPAGWVGLQTCGWCMTGDCDDCLVTTTYYEKTWACKCQCQQKEQAA